MTTQLWSKETKISKIFVGRKTGNDKIANMVKGMNLDGKNHVVKPKAYDFDAAQTNADIIKIKTKMRIKKLHKRMERAVQETEYYIRSELLEADHKNQ